MRAFEHGLKYIRTRLQEERDRPAFLQSLIPLP